MPNVKIIHNKRPDNGKVWRGKPELKPRQEFRFPPSVVASTEDRDAVREALRCYIALVSEDMDYLPNTSLQAIAQRVLKRIED